MRQRLGCLIDAAPQQIKTVLEPTCWCEAVPGLREQPETQLGPIGQCFAIPRRANGKRQAVKDNCHEHDAHARFKSPTYLEFEQGLVNLAPKPSGSDECSQNRQPKRHHNGLVDSEYD